MAGSEVHHSGDSSVEETSENKRKGCSHRSAFCLVETLQDREHQYHKTVSVAPGNLSLHQHPPGCSCHCCRWQARRSCAPALPRCSFRPAVRPALCAQSARQSPQPSLHAHISIVRPMPDFHPGWSVVSNKICSPKGPLLFTKALVTEEGRQCPCYHHHCHHLTPCRATLGLGALQQRFFTSFQISLSWQSSTMSETVQDCPSLS